MTEEVVKTKAQSFWMGAKVKLVGLAATGSTLVASVSADTDINASVGPILDSVIALMPTLINLIVAVVPAIIVMAVVGFVTGFFDGIIGKIKI